MNGIHLPTCEKHGIRDIIKGQLEETENHILMSETSRWYPKNQLITSIEDQGYTDKAAHEYDDNEYNNRESGFNDWIRRHLKGFMANGFNEYNSNTYSGYSISALANLYDFAEDTQVKKAARIVLDFHAARFATQSFDLKQCVGFNRKPKHLKRPELWFGPMTSWYAVLMGNYADLQEDYDGIWQWRTQHMFFAAVTSYTVPDLILDLAIDKSHNPYEITVNYRPPDDFDPSRTVQEFPHSKNIEILRRAPGQVAHKPYQWRGPGTGLS
ncbi:MAG: hypothetical protein ACMUIU_01805 [bacterium]